jgi:hypothetical protein
MDTKVLETFPFWPGYIILPIAGLFLIASFWACGVHILAAFYAPRVPYRRVPGVIRTVFFTFCAITTFWVFFSMMFVRFHAVVIKPDHIELVYCWPRHNLSLAASELQSASIHHYRDKGCRLEILAGEAHFRSIDSTENAAAQQIEQAVDTMAKR